MTNYRSISFFKSRESKQFHSFIGSFIAITEHLSIIHVSDRLNLDMLMINAWGILSDTRRKYVFKTDSCLTLNLASLALLLPITL